MPLMLNSLVMPGFIGLFFLLIVIFTLMQRGKTRRNLRPIPAFTHLSKAIGRAVEAGTRLHISIGRGTLTSPQSAVGFVGLSILGRVVQVASASDSPPVASAGDGALAILSQDTLKSTYQDIGTASQYEPSAGRLAGVTPFSYAAGVLPITRDENVSANILVGSFGNEVALILEASERAEVFTLAGTDSITAQSILYAAAQEPLVGEEVFAGGAYINAGPVHTASLHAQDVLRWLIVGAILIGSLLKVLGI